MHNRSKFEISNLKVMSIANCLGSEIPTDNAFVILTVRTVTIAY